MKHVTRNRSRRGSAVLESAFVFFPLMLITFGCVEFGYFFFIKHTLQGASREGARAAAVRDSVNNDVTVAVSNAMKAAGIDQANYTVKIRNANAPEGAAINVNQTPGTGILVRVECTWSVVGVSPMRLISQNKLVVGQTTMRKEG